MLQMGSRGLRRDLATLPSDKMWIWALWAGHRRPNQINTIQYSWLLIQKSKVTVLNFFLGFFAPFFSHVWRCVTGDQVARL